MNTEFLTILDIDDEWVGTVKYKPSQLLGEIINTKTVGKNTSRIYKTNLPECARVYSYNFKTNKVEIDEIVAIEQIKGDFQNCEVSTYKTTMIEMAETDRIATVDRTAGYKFKFSSAKDLLNSKSLAVLQIENYAQVCEDGDMAMIASDGVDEIELSMSFDIGLLIGHWLGIGNILDYNGYDALFFYPNTETDAQSIVDILKTSFPDNINEIIQDTNKWNKQQIIFTNPIITAWVKNTHGEGENKSIPMTYYSSPMEFISGLLYGMMMATGRHSMNHLKKVMYYTFSSISKTLIMQIIEILNIYASIHANISNFTIEKNQKVLYLANIRVTSGVLDSIPIQSFISEIDEEYIPKSNRHTLKSDDDIIVITRMTIAQIENCVDDYIIHLKNGNSIIGVTGIIHRAKYAS